MSLLLLCCVTKTMTAIAVVMTLYCLQTTDDSPVFRVFWVDADGKPDAIMEQAGLQVLQHLTENTVQQVNADLFRFASSPCTLRI